jgi:hypothetical protein
MGSSQFWRWCGTWASCTVQAVYLVVARWLLPPRELPVACALMVVFLLLDRDFSSWSFDIDFPYVEVTMACCRRRYFFLPLARRSAGRPLMRTHDSRLGDGDVLCPSTASGLEAIGLVHCRHYAREVRVVSCTGLYGTKPKKPGFGVRILSAATQLKIREVHRLAPQVYSTNNQKQIPADGLQRRTHWQTQGRRENDSRGPTTAYEREQETDDLLNQYAPPQHPFPNHMHNEL